MDKLPIGLSVFLTFISGLLFAADLKGYFNPVPAAIATVTEAQGTVRRLARHEFAWDRAEIGTPFASKDAVATGEDATAKLHFKDGAEVQLDPASMLVIDTRTSELVLNFVTGGGKVRVARNSARRVVATRVPPVPTKTASAPASPPPPQPPVEIETVEELPAPAPIAANTPPVAPVRAPLVAEAVPESSLRDPGAASKIRAELARIAELPTAPSPQSPAEGAHIELSGSTKMTLAWEPLAEKVDGYEITLRPLLVGGEARIIWSKTPSLTLPSLRAGRYAWSVRTVSGKLRSASTPPRWFDVSLAPTAEPEVIPAPPPPVKAPARSAVENKKINLLPVSVE